MKIFIKSGSELDFFHTARIHNSIENARSTFTWEQMKKLYESGDYLAINDVEHSFGDILCEVVYIDEDAQEVQLSNFNIVN